MFNVYANGYGTVNVMLLYVLWKCGNNVVDNL